MKKHTTVTITLAMLEKLNPCGSGLAAARAFLPAKLSTDPEQNIALACDLVTNDPPVQVHWLREVVCENEASICCAACDRDYVYNSESRWVQEPEVDPMLVAQYLAWVADKLATDAGR